MAKRILTYFLFALTLCFTPVFAENATARIELNDTDTQSIKIEQMGDVVYITGATGKVAYVYNLIGMVMTTIRIDSPEKKIDLSHLKKGIYPVKVGNVSKKIHVQGR